MSFNKNENANGKVEKDSKMSSKPSDSNDSDYTPFGHWADRAREIDADPSQRTVICE